MWITSQELRVEVINISPGTNSRLFVCLVCLSWCSSPNIRSFCGSKQPCGSSCITPCGLGGCNHHRCASYSSESFVLVPGVLSAIVNETGQTDQKTNPNLCDSARCLLVTLTLGFQRWSFIIYGE